MQSLLVQERGLSYNQKKLFSVLLTCYLILKPFYIFNSGLPQFADAILMVMMFISMLKLERDTLRHNSFLSWGVVFLYYSVIVNVIWGILLGGKLGLAMNSIFYLFNLIVTIVFINVSLKLGKADFMKVLFYATGYSVLIQCALIPFFLQKNGIRTTLMFNNPNQLGYFGILSLAILLVTSPKLKLKPFFFFLSILASFALILISLSKAAIISGLLTIFLFLIFKTHNADIRKTKKYLLVLIIVLVTLVSLNAKIIVQSQFAQDVVARMDSIGHDNDDNLEGRGYDRIYNYPYYVFLGAGEGLVGRFNAHKEMHSTIGNILFSYGFVGLTLFAVFIYHAVSKLKFAMTYPLYTVLLFGLTHNGIRHTYLWLLLVLLFISKTNTEEE
ncbi:O-antigen ligase family protein [Paenibacillus montanisoli]|uniref:O-antigen ligase domain-containing protein n=1 Tax=Paenibacillus montanisoli TaxID=2081970 RepID=A0A328UBW5_9BACL|nr:hypothetical protein [Paenibacillus montanisoli]RAP77486.1 hypothetical protein DL346_03120 [Paenibacillus montanisoli]